MNPLKLTGRRPRTGAALLLLWLGLLSATGLRADVPPEAVEQGLQAAGANRASLERVLEDYRRGPSREKYDAACYLVAHMRWHKRAGYVERYDPLLDSLWTVATTAYLKLTTGHSAADQRRQPLRKALNDTAAALRKRTQALRLTPPAMHIEELPDAASLTGDYVRRQVEHAMRLRQRSPWARSLKWDDFCEYVLPYRAIGFYPMTDDPARTDSLFAPILRADTAQSLVDVAQRYNQYVSWLRRTGGKYPFEGNCGLPELMFGGLHDCIDVAHYGALALRAAGVPVAVEYNSAYRLWEGHHFMVAVRMPDGAWRPFSPESNLPVAASGKFPGSLNLYRLHFAPWPDNPYALRAPGEPLPPEVADPCIEDVTALYGPVGSLTLDVPPTVPAKRRMLYLATFRGEAGLQAVTWSRIDSAARQATFDRVVPDNLYFPTCADAMGRLRPAGRPLWVAADSTRPGGLRVDTLPAPTGQKVKAILTRKFPWKSDLVAQARRMEDVVVLGSDQRNFAQADTLARIGAIEGPYWADVPLHAKRPYRYYRVRTPKSHPHMHLAELQFLARRDRDYTNVIAPTPLVAHTPADTARRDTGWVRLMAEPLEKCGWRREYDGNVQTAPDRWPDVTLALAEPQWVDALRFAPKSAANTVVHGHHYRLMRWDDRRGWRTEWMRPATYDYLEAELEVGGLYRLTDLTEGREELPFTLDAEGRQRFPHVQWSDSGLE